MSVYLSLNLRSILAAGKAAATLGALRNVCRLFLAGSTRAAVILNPPAGPLRRYWLLVRCWYEYCGAVNGRNDLDACWLIAHDARIPLSPAGNVKKRIACALDPKIIPDNIACRGKGEHWLCCVGCCYEVETLANACDTGRQTASYFVLGKSVKLQQCRLATAAICRIQVCGLRNRG